MRSIKNYLNESIENEDYLSESVLDNSTIFSGRESDKEAIENWLNDNYKITGRLTIKDISGDIVIGCTGSVEVKNILRINSLTNGMFRWGVVRHYFDCVNCYELTSLEGAPEKVGGYFNCTYCRKLTSLEGAPKEVGGWFACSSCGELTSLEGAPMTVKGDFDCDNCKKLLFSMYKSKIPRRCS